MKIKTKTAAQFGVIATLIYIGLVLPALAKDQETRGGKKETGSTGGIPAGTWTYSRRWDMTGLTYTTSSTITISSGGSATCRETNEAQLQSGLYFGMSKTKGGAPPARIMGRNHLKWTKVSQGNKVKRVGFDLYMYMSGKEQMLSSQSDPPGLTSEDIRWVGDNGARVSHQTPNSKESFPVDVYHIQGDTLVQQQDSRSGSKVYTRAGSR